MPAYIGRYFEASVIVRDSNKLEGSPCGYWGTDDAYLHLFLPSAGGGRVPSETWFPKARAETEKWLLTELPRS